MTRGTWMKNGSEARAAIDAAANAAIGGVPMGNHGDEWEIYKVAARLAQAADDRDSAAYRACLADLIWTDRSRRNPPITAEQYVRAAMVRLSRAAWTHHQLMNAVIDIDADGQRGSARIDVVVKICEVDARREHLRSTIGGRYQLELVRSERSWLIDYRSLSHRYSYGVPFASCRSLIVPTTIDRKQLE